MFQAPKPETSAPERSPPERPDSVTKKEGEKGCAPVCRILIGRLRDCVFVARREKRNKKKKG